MIPAEILSTHTAALFEAAVKRAAELLRAGEVVALPTETVYGLAANALDAKAVAKIFEIKGRPRTIPSSFMSRTWRWRNAASATGRDGGATGQSFLARSADPGVAAAKIIPDIVTAGGATVGVRWPSHPFIQAVIRECGFPLAAPSANLSNQLSPTNAEHVRKQLGDKLPLIVDGGQSQVGIESTVIDLTETPPRVLRPGMIHEESLVAVVGQLAMGNPEPGTLRSPGQLPKHYSPKAKLVIGSWRDAGEFNLQLSSLNPPRSCIHVIAHTHIPTDEGLGGVSVIPHDAEAFARALYAELHRCDEAGAALIVVEALPAGIEWRAIADRLNRAAS